ncbi:sulfatase-like hydrolase/transferase [Verrucomicrobiaceae bacterium N1E253]|uniref:Sulfatase-like hydrolase/transferase n=1 Tax=Oceaniferula marina TaxID=2748318 RepID=A0A851GDC2_9BACT|nr:sulfatase-like hydrolase/transferase [Oceaniferula marina]NWK55553.1 sulfatase-like hydrolase/transferase [Oceaniferula marina]
MFRLATIVFLFASATGFSQNSKHPNILFFLVDDMGTQDTSVSFIQDQHNAQVISKLNRLYRTPNMEQLAKQGRLFTQAHAYSVCSPTRVSLMTGLDAPRHKVTQWTHPKTHRSQPGPVKTKTIRNPEWAVKGVPDNTPTLPAILKKAGYATLFAGKAHFGPDDTPNGDPTHLGFDVNIAGFGGGGPGSYYGSNHYSAAHRNGGHDWDVPGLEKYHGTDTFLTEAITLEMNAAIEKAVGEKKPFFAYMSHYAVHAPFLYPDKRFTKNYPNLRGYSLAFATLVEGMDKSLGDMLQKLEELGVAEDTLVIFYSDNGSANPMGSSPLRGKKGTRHEGGTRVPLIVAWAKPNPNNQFQKQLSIPQNSKENALVTCTDMLPTILNIAGAKHPKPDTLDGFDISPYFTGKDAKRPQEFLVHFPHGHTNSMFSTYLRDGWKVIYNYTAAPDKQWELYHLNSDPYEKSNLAKQSPERLKSMAAAMISELDQRQASYPVSTADGSPVKPRIPGSTTTSKAVTTDTYQPKLKPYSKDNHFVSKDWFNWGGSIIKGQDNHYYLFYSRWPKSISFYAWLTHSEVAVAKAPTASGPWTYQYTALKGRGGKHWDEITAHNPKIKRFNGKYYLYYISTNAGLNNEALVATAKKGYSHPNWRTLRYNQRCGVAVADSLNGPWIRFDHPCVEPKPPVHEITVNPAVTQKPDGSFLMLIKGDKFPKKGGQRVQGIALSDKPEGPFTIQPQLAISDFDTEDASIWFDRTRQRYYANFHAHTYFGMITSTDGIHWQKAKQFHFAPKAFKSADGSTFKGKRMERPNVYIGASDQPEVFISSYRKGNETGIFTIPMEQN